ncbi:VacJ family lipoprotein [Minwuia sp.]|uniref:MlaA family lipoprotein n=1 Tax=Minwuia sp. TaxID=2493630 RepID=UPI003A9545BD
MQLLSAAALMTMAACASLPSDPDARAERVEVNDPLEPFNRTMFGFNNALDAAVLKPVAQAYDAILPTPAKGAVRNALNNMGEPITFMNAVLQGEFVRARETLTRFVFNSTFGLGGLVDFMGDLGMKRHDEDFGQTLAVWGVPDGPYLVLPFLGPSQVRDLTGFAVDSFADPVNRTFRGHDIDWAPYARTGTDIVSRRAQLLGKLEELERNSIDFYATIRSGYRQRRQAEITNGAAQAPADLYSESLPTN